MVAECMVAECTEYRKGKFNLTLWYQAPVERHKLMNILRYTLLKIGNSYDLKSVFCCSMLLKYFL